MKRRFLTLLLAALAALSVLTLTASADELTADYSWYDASADAYTIADAADLMGLARIANGTADGITQSNFKGKTVTLGADIDLGGATWTPINSFSGTLDGAEHVIKNFKMGVLTDSEGYQYCGFINDLAWNTGLICNLTLQDITAEVGSDGRFGAAVCYALGGNDKDYTDHQIYNVHVKNVAVTCTASDDSARIGGMFCRVTRSVKDCTVENLTVRVPHGAITVGGFVSFVYGNNQRIQNCEVNNFQVNVANCEHSNNCGIGGFVGCMSNSYGWTNYFENCSVTGLDLTVSGTEAWVGGFVGTPCANIIASDCSAQGKIDGSGVTGGFIGGFMGNFGWKAANGGIALLHDLTDCAADVDIISGGAPAGGFIGSASTSNGGSKYGVFTNCTASGDVTNETGLAGGFAGEAVSGRYNNCTATGTVAGQTAGGFVGEVRDYTPAWDNVYYDKIGNANEIDITDCTVSGTVVGSDSVGGLIGEVGEKTSPDQDGSNGKLVISGSKVESVVVGTTSDTKVDQIANASDESKKLDAEHSTGNTNSTEIITPPAGSTITKTNDGGLNVPAGSVINKAGASAPTIVPEGGLVLATKLTLDRDTATIYVGGSVQLTAAPAGAEVIWTSGNESIAVVDAAGKVTGREAGTVTITAASGTVQATCVVTVKDWPLLLLPGVENRSFSDVSQTSYCYDAVQWAVENHVTDGIAEDRFGPELGCTRRHATGCDLPVACRRVPHSQKL